MQEDESYLNKRGLTHFWENIDALKQDKLTAGANITIASDNTISASQPTVNNATLTIQKEGASVGTFTANASTNATVNIIETDPTVPAWAKASSKPSYSWTEITNKPTIPTKTSDLTNDSGFLTSIPIASSSVLGGIMVGSGLAISSGGVLSATGGGTADDVAWGHITGTMADQTDLTTALAAKANSADLATVATSGDYDDLTDKPTIGNATLTIQKNGTSAGTFTSNATSNKTINITVPTTAADVSALPASTKYGASIAVSINTTDYKVTTTLKDQDGNTLGTAQVIDLPLESVVVNGSYDNTNKKIVLTLQNGNTIDIPVADLVAGLQSEITSTNKLASDLVDDTNQTHKFMTSAEKTKLSGIAAGAEVNVQSDWSQTTTTADDYIKNKPSIPTKTSDLTNDSNFVSDANYVHTDNNYTTAEKNKLSGIAAGAEVNVQSDWSQTTATADDYIKNKPTLATVATSGSYNDLSNKPTIPTVNNATLTIQKNGTNVQTFTANQGTNATANITVPTKTSDLTNDSGFLDSVAWGDVTGKPTFATVATSGSYNDLSNKPTIPAAQVQSDWAQTTTTAVDYIKNKPSLATVATSGSYNDLSNKPTIGNATLTVKHNNVSQGTFTANATTNSTVDIKAPQRVDLSNTAQTNSYRRTVIGLCEVSTANNTEKDSFSSGRIVMHRNNGLSGAVEINIQIENQYSNAYYTNVAWYANLKLLSASADINTAKGFRPCTFKYNDVWYGGIEVFVDNAQLNHVVFEGDTNFAVFALDYYQVPHGQTASAILNQEVYDSLNYSQWTLSKGKEFFDNIDLYTGSMTKNDTYTYTFPDKNGTVAMTSDIPSVPTVNNGQLTIQKNGTNVQTFTANQGTDVTANITVPTKTSDLTNDSDFVASSGTVAKANQLTTARTIAISGGATGTATSFNGTGNISIPITDVKSAYVTWGGKDIVQSVSPDDAGCIDEFGHNKLAFLPAECIEVKYSTDGGTTWTDYGLTDAQKIAMVTTTGVQVGAGKGTTITADNIANMRGRVRIACGTLARSGKIYTRLKKILINFSTNGATGTKIKMRYRTIANYLSDTDTWVDLGTHDIGGWSGWNSYPYTAGNFGGNMTNQTGQPGQIEFEFWGTGYNSNYNSRCALMDIRFIGETNWTTPSELARAGHLYTMDTSQSATFPAKVTAPIIETGTGANNYFQSQKFRGQGDASSYYHAVDFGYGGHNQVDFYEYGGAWNFWRNTTTTATTDVNNLALGVTIDALKNKSYTYTFPNRTGTFALTSDIPAAITVDSALSSSSENPVQNKVINTALSGKQASLSTAQLDAANSGITSTKVASYDAYASQIAAKADLTALDDKQDTLTAGDHIDITNDVISAVDYVHSENPVSVTSTTPTVTGSMIANGTITADKLATGATIQLTLSTTDIGEGASLAANTLYGVYQ